MSKGAKYVKRSDLEAVQVAAQEPKVPKLAEAQQDPTDDHQDVPLEEMITRFRAKNEPIKLFDESDSSRLKRLAEIEAREDSFNGQRNDYLDILDANEEKSELRHLYGGGKNADKRDFDNPEFDTKLITLDNFNDDPLLVSKLISVYFQRIISDWEDVLESRPMEEKKSTEGKRAAGNCSQAKEYLKPFFKKLRKRQIDSEIIKRIVEICEFMQIREYQKANDVYLKLSIGNAAWPIGISGTSIHERSALERIETSHSAGHVLNDEVRIFIFIYKTTRKWVQSIKRLMTFTQSVNPSQDLSKNMG